MPHLQKEILHSAAQLIEEEKFEEASKCLNQLGHGNINELPKDIQIKYFLLRAKFDLQLKKYPEALTWVENVLRLYLITGDELARLEGTILKAQLMLNQGRYDECRNLLTNAEDIVSLLENPPEKVLIEKKQKIAHLWAIYYWEIGVYSKLFEYAQQNLQLSQKSEEQYAIARAHLVMGLAYGENGHLNAAIAEYEKSAHFAHNLTEPLKSRLLSSAFNNIGENYRLKGELDRSLVYYQKSLELDENGSDLQAKATVLHNIGLIYAEKGEKEKSLKYLLKSLEIERNLGNNFEIVRTDFDILCNHFENLPLGAEAEYLQEIKRIRDLKDYHSPAIEFRFQLARALGMKNSGESRQIIKAEEILSQLIDNPDLGNELKITAMLFLCEILFQELQLNPEEKLLDEISDIIEKLRIIAEKERSFSLLAEVSLVRAKLKLLRLNLREAQILFIKAQQLASSYNLSRLAGRISQEHDRMLYNMQEWKKILSEHAPLQERLNLTTLKDDLEVMMRRHPLELTPIEEETPLFLSIITQTGSPLLSFYFSEEFKNASLFSLFLTAFNTFSNEFFNNSIDRVKIARNTILIKQFQNFQNVFVCYVIQGPSFPAQEKLVRFTERLNNSQEFRELLAGALTNNEIININEYPTLKSLIQSVFVDQQA